MAREATLSVSLTHHLNAYVRGKVDSGQFESASEVIRQGLRTMQELEHREHLYWSDLRKKVKEARVAIADGDVTDGPSFMRSKIESLKSRALADKSSPRSTPQRKARAKKRP